MAELRSNLGLLDYYGNFIPILSTLLQPLHELLWKGVKRGWTEECEKAFVRSKSELVADKVLVPYDETRKLILACDASPYGVGAMTSHVMEDGEVSQEVSQVSTRSNFSPVHLLGPKTAIPT